MQPVRDAAHHPLERTERGMAERRGEMAAGEGDERCDSASMVHSLCAGGALAEHLRGEGGRKGSRRWGGVRQAGWRQVGRQWVGG